MYFELVILLEQYRGWQLWFETIYCPLQDQEKEAIKAYFNMAMPCDGHPWLDFQTPIIGTITACERGLHLLRENESKKDYDHWLTMEVIEIIRQHGSLLNAFKKLYEQIKSTS